MAALFINKNYSIIAFTDSQNTCECCGKTNLKGTFCVEIYGIEAYYGSTCAWKKHGIDKDGLKLAKKISQGKKTYDVTEYEIIETSYSHITTAKEGNTINFLHKHEAINYMGDQAEKECYHNTRNLKKQYYIKTEAESFYCKGTEKTGYRINFKC